MANLGYLHWRLRSLGERPLGPDDGAKYAARHTELYYVATSGEPSFKQLILAWRLANSPDSKKKAAGDWLFRNMKKRFEQNQSKIIKEYYCRNIIGGCALTSAHTVHSVVQTTELSLVKSEVECKVMNWEARNTFKRKNSADQLKEAADHVYSALTRIMYAAELVDADRRHVSPERLQAVKSAVDETSDVKRRINVLLQRQSRYEYFIGTLFGSLPTFILSASIGWLSYHWWHAAVSVSCLTAATVLAAIGAVISVIQRMAAGTLIVDNTATRLQRTVLGGLRPFVGAAFGAVSYFVLLIGATTTSDVSHPDIKLIASFGLAGFAAGFSERFARDMLERSGKLLDEGAPADQAKGKSSWLRDDTAPAPGVTAGKGRDG